MQVRGEGEAEETGRGAWSVAGEEEVREEMNAARKCIVYRRRHTAIDKPTTTVIIPIH